MKKVIWSGVAPTAYVTKSKQRIKQHFDTVYLNNGEEFEIELYNPTENKVLAEIELNGKSIGGGGIVLRPGERAYLERFIDDNKKFLFETYLVGNSEEVKRAIQKNGTVTVKFYKEVTVNPWIYGSSVTYTNTFSTPTITNPPYYGNGDITSPNVFYCATADSFGMERGVEISAQSSMNEPKQFTNSVSKKTETGRVEKGSQSQQSFTYDHSSFESWYSWQTTWKILPFSQKLVDPTEIRIYCTSCGTRRKKQSHMFCPSCGTKF